MPRAGTGTLQVVPTLSGISGQPGVDASFSLSGSGFLEGGSTVSFGGVSFVDRYANQPQGDVIGSNDQLNGLVMRSAVERRVRLSTAGGWAELDLPVAVAPAFVELGTLTARATDGIIADPAQASANAGQVITLIGRGLTNSTLVLFEATDPSGAPWHAEPHGHGLGRRHQPDGDGAGPGGPAWCACRAVPRPCRCRSCRRCGPWAAAWRPATD